MLELKYTKLNPRAIEPSLATEGAAGMDISIILPDPPFEVRLSPGQSHIFSTGLAFEVPKGWGMFILSRSGHGFNYDVSLSNSVGLIDSDYRGEVKIKLINKGKTPLVIKDKDRVGQFVLLQVPQLRLIQVGSGDMSETERGTEGFGSTGA